MEAKILEEKQNPLFNRKEVKIEIESALPPSKAEATKIVSEKFSSSEDKVKLEKIDSRFGSSKFIIIAKVYGSLEEKERIEPKIKQKKPKS